MPRLQTAARPRRRAAREHTHPVSAVSSQFPTARAAHVTHILTQGALDGAEIECNRVDESRDVEDRVRHRSDPRSQQSPPSGSPRRWRAPPRRWRGRRPVGERRLHHARRTRVGGRQQAPTPPPPPLLPPSPPRRRLAGARAAAAARCRLGRLANSRADASSSVGGCREPRRLAAFAVSASCAAAAAAAPPAASAGVRTVRRAADGGRTSQASQMLGGRWSFGVVRREAAYDRPSAMRSASGCTTAGTEARRTRAASAQRQQRRERRR